MIWTIYESMDDAVRVAREVLAGTVDPNLGCGLIGDTIAAKLGYPGALMALQLLAHEQEGHEALGITPQSSVPDILAACRELVAAAE